MSKKKKILSKHNLRRSVEANDTHKLRAAYVEAAKAHFMQMWSNTLSKLDPVERFRIVDMVERWADDFADQAEKGLIATRAGFSVPGYVPPNRQ